MWKESRRSFTHIHFGVVCGAGVELGRKWTWEKIGHHSPWHENWNVEANCKITVLAYQKWNGGGGSLVIHLKTVLTYSNVVVLLLLLFKYCQQRKDLVSGKMARTLFLAKSCLCVRGWSNETNVPFVRKSLFHLEKQQQELQLEALQPQRVSSQLRFPDRSRKRKWRHRGLLESKELGFLWRVN